VRRPGQRTLALVGDLTYDVHLLNQGHVPGVGDRGMLHQSTAMLIQLRAHTPGLVVLAAHDPGAATALAAAMAA
jgi:N-acyl homoserine lactone hydrolase